MLVSIAVYAQVFGWKYAVGFVLLLLCHEMGHYIAARQRGLDVVCRRLFLSLAPGSNSKLKT
jgi:membrane-associated protease RseP (regulator of RpoE activity)